MWPSFAAVLMVAMWIKLWLFIFLLFSFSLSLSISFSQVYMVHKWSLVLVGSLAMFQGLTGTGILLIMNWLWNHFFICFCLLSFCRNVLWLVQTVLNQTDNYNTLFVIFFCFSGLFISSLCREEISALQIMAGSFYPVLLLSGNVILINEGGGRGGVM